MAKAATYDLKQVICTVNYDDLSAFGDDGAIKIEPNSDTLEHITAADGSQHVFSRNNDYSAKVTISLLETSRSYADLKSQWEEQCTEAPIAERPFRMYDPLNGDEVLDSYTMFMSPPVVSKSKGVGYRDFNIILPNAYAPGNYFAGTQNT